MSGPLTSSMTVLAAKLRSKTRGHKPPTVFLNIGRMANLLLFTDWSLIAETWEKITLKDTDEIKSSTYKAKYSVKHFLSVWTTSLLLDASIFKPFLCTKTNTLILSALSIEVQTSAYLSSCCNSDNLQQKLFFSLANFFFFFALD